MFSTLRFLLNKPLFTVPVVLLILAALTTHKAPQQKTHINPWAASAVSGEASDGASDSSDSAATAASSQ